MDGPGPRGIAGVEWIDASKQCILDWRSQGYGREGVRAVGIAVPPAIRVASGVNTDARASL